MNILVRWLEYFFTMLVMAWGAAGILFGLIYFGCLFVDKGHPFLTLVLLTFVIAAIFSTAGVLLGKD